MSKATKLNFETIENPFNSNLDRGEGEMDSLADKTGLFSTDSVKSDDDGISKKVSGNELDNLWITSWIKSRNYKPQSTGFMFDGKTGKIECRELEVTSGKIRYNKTSFSDSVNEGYWIGNEGVYFGAAADATKFKFTIATGVIELVKVAIDGTSTIDGKFGTGFSTVVDDGATPAIPTGLTVTAGIQYNLLEWTANSETDMSHYEVWRNTVDNSGTATKIGDNKTTLMVDGGLTGGQAYYYWLKAVDHLGNTSGFNAVGGTTATPRNVTNSDVTQGIVAEKILIDGAVYLSNWRKTGSLTKIDGGELYVGSLIEIASSGHMRSGQTAYETGTGWWIGDVSGTPKLSIGSASNYFKWTGTNITWKGTNTELDASGNLVASSVTVSGGLTTGAGSTINGTYIDSLVANKIIAGTGVINALTVKSTLTIGDSGTNGTIQSYGWNGSVNGFQLLGGASPSLTLIGGTITAGVIKTALTNKRVELNSTGNLNEIAFYNLDNTLSGKFYGAGTEIQGGPWLFLTAKTYIDGETWVTGDLKLHGSGDKYFYLRTATVTPSWIKAISSSPYELQFNRSLITSGTCNLGSTTNGWTYLYLGSSTGKYIKYEATGFQVNHYIHPDNDGNYSIGTASKRFYAGYFSGRLRIPVGTNLY